MLRVILIFLGTILISSQVFASPEKFQIQTTFQFKDTKRSLEKKGEVILSEKGNSWTTLVNGDGGLTVLGHLVKANKKSIHMEYVVVDSQSAGEGVISTPNIIVLLNEPAVMMTEGNNQKITVKLLAQRK